MRRAMKPVVQEQPMGCGVACIAAAANRTYQDALSHVDAQHASGRGYYCAELVAALAEMGRKCEFAEVTPETRSLLEKPGVIVFVAPSKRYPAGHYLLKTEQGWMNPWKNYPNIHPAEAGFEDELPGEAEWIIFPEER